MIDAESRPNLDSWHAQLLQLQAAEARGDRVEAMRRRRSLVAERLRWRTEIGALEIATADFALLDRLSGDLQREGFHEEALLICRACAQWATQQGDRYGAIHFVAAASQCATALLDFTAAAAFLKEVLLPEADPDVPDDAATIARVNHLVVPAVDASDLGELRAELALALTRYWAARGRLGAADRALSSVLGNAEAASLRLVSLGELSLMLAEIRLDRGDLVGFHALRRIGREDEPAEDARWMVLDGSACLLQGRFSEATEHFQCALQLPVGGATAGWRCSAQWQQIHGLCALNRMDEAEELLSRLVEEGGINRTDLEVMRDLILARRAIGPLDYGLPPSVKETLDPVPSEDLPKAASDREEEVTDMTAPRRTCERVRDEWSRLSNQIQLHLHGGRIESALQLFLPLPAWTPHIDSPLLAARLEYLWALVAHYAGDYGSAERHSGEAMARFRQLELLPDEWAACRVHAWSLERQHAPVERLRPTQARARALLDAIRNRLSEADRISLSLNKWSAIEEAISAECHQLREEVTAAPENRRRTQFISLHLGRRVEQSLNRLLTVRRWEVTAYPGAPQEERAWTNGAGGDLFSWAREQLQFRRGARAPRSFGRVNHRWLRSDTAVLTYVVLPDRVELFLVTHQGSRLLDQSKNVSKVELWQIVRRSLKRLQYDKTWSAARLRELSEVLGLDRVANELPRPIRHLVIIPDNILVNVPFAVLPIGEHPLMERFTCAVLPRMRWVPRIPRLARRYGQSLACAVRDSESAPEYPAVPFTEEEIQAVRQLRVQRVVVCIGAEATRARFLTALPEMDTAHLACHGEFHPDSPHQSGLLFHDGWLTVRDVYGLTDCRLDFAVLGSCWGGNVTLLPGGEAIGLPTAFLEVGARAVVTSFSGSP